MVSSGISNTSNVASKKDSSFNFTTKTDSNGLDFNKMMTQSISSNVDTKSTGMASKKITTSDATSSNSISINSINNNKDVNNDKDVENNQALKSNKAENQKLEKADGNKSDDVVDSKIDDMIDKIKDEIKKTFGISEEQLETALANLGITMQDLLKSTNLTNLVCEVTGTQDALTLLTDSGLSEQLKSVMDFINTQVGNLAQEMNISMDDLKAYIENISNSNKDKAAVNYIQVDENASALNVQSEDVSNRISNDETIKNSSKEQPNNDLQSVVEAKVTVSTEQQSNGSMSKNSSESNDKNQDYNTITNNISQSIQNAFDKIIVEGANKIDTVDVIRQIVEAAKVTVIQEISSMEIQLNPENLGKINLSVVAKEGVITAQITAENEAVKKVIENQLSVLKENFNNQGIKVEAIEVTIASHSFESNQNLSKEDSNQDNEGKKTNKSLRLDSIEDLNDDELLVEEKRVMQLLNGKNSSVEYSA